MAQITVAAVQMTCTTDPAQNLAHAEELVRQAAAKGAQIVLLPELFERPYFCQERRYEYYDYALPVNENPAVQRFSQVCRELELAMPVSFYEKDGQRLFNSVAISRMTTITRKSFISRPAIPVSKCLIPSMAGWVLASAGTSGSRRRRAA